MAKMAAIQAHVKKVDMTEYIAYLLWVPLMAKT